MIRDLLLRNLIALVTVLSFGFAQIEVKGIVLGDGLGWEIKDVNMLLAIGEDSPVKLEIYSPGFDPDDYRAELFGQEELGDENYDPNSILRGEFILAQAGSVIADGGYAVEKHRWVTLYEGTLAAGGYTLTSRFFGNAKNAYIYRLTTPNPQIASLSFAEGTELFDIRGRDWVKGFEVNLPADALPSRYALYDGDGPEELEAKVIMPNGQERMLEVSGKLEWVTWEFSEPGRYQIMFRIPETAYQYSNTVALRELFPNPVTVEVVDTAGNAIDLAYSLTGYSIREADLPNLANYRLVGLEQTAGTALTETKYQFGFEGGHIRYILALPLPIPTAAVDYSPPALLTVTSSLVLPSSERPYPLQFQLNDETQRIAAEGTREFRLSAGSYSFSASLAGATLAIPETLTLERGESKTVHFKIYPQVDLSLDVFPKELILGESTTIRTTASTDFADLLPADLYLSLPQGWQLSAQDRLTSPLSNTRTAVVELIASPNETGIFPVFSNLDDWGLAKTDTVKVVQPATLSLNKSSSVSQAIAGEEVEFTLSVSNTGDVEAKNILLKDHLPASLNGENLEESFNLAAGQSKSFSLSATVTNDAPETLTNEASLSFNGQALSSSATLTILKANVELNRGLSESIVLPSETVTVTLNVSNTGQAPLSYQLTDTPPEWLEPLTDLSFSGTLAVGESASHSYQANVRFGPEASANFTANLTSNAGPLSATDSLTRKLVPLEKSASKDIIVEGDSLDFLVRITNPLARSVTLDLRESPDAGLNLDASSLTSLTFTALESKELSFSATPSRIGELLNEVSIFLGSNPVGFPAQAGVVVKPLLKAERISDISLPFTLEAEQGDKLLISHKQLANSSYEIGSSRLNGELIADPKVRSFSTIAEDGSTNESTLLYWELEFMTEGVISYSLRHSEELSAVNEPSLTLKAGLREITLQGNHSFSELSEARELSLKERDGLIKEPLANTIYRTLDQAKVVIELNVNVSPELKLNGETVDKKYLGKLELNEESGLQRLEYYGLPLLIGENNLELIAGSERDQISIFRAANPSNLNITPVTLAADGVTPIQFEITATDNNGLTNGFGAVTIETNLEPLKPDAFPDMSGYQVLMKEGVARLDLSPVSYAQRGLIKAEFNALEIEHESFIGGTSTNLYSVQGVISARFNKGNLSISGNAKGYLETPFANGSLQAALDSTGDLERVTEDSERFPLTGSGKDAQASLRSQDFFAIRYDDATYSLGYYTSTIYMPGLNLASELTALQAEARLKPNQYDQLTPSAFIALSPSDISKQEITPDGTRFYLIKDIADGIKAGSETLTVKIGAEEKTLIRLVDYSINYLTGSIILINPLQAKDPNSGQDVKLNISYQKRDLSRDSLSYGLGVKYQLQNWQFGLSTVQQNGLNLGAYAEYQSTTLNFKSSYNYNPDNNAQLGLSLNFEQNALTGNLNLSYNTQLQGQARLAYSLNENQDLALEQSSSSTRNQTNILYEQKLDPFKLGLGVAYVWEKQDLNAVLRAGYSNERFGVNLTHTQPFSNQSQALSDLSVSYKLDDNLSLTSDLSYTWGLNLSGSLGLIQRLGNGSLALSYQLPGANGAGNRARFGIDTPLALSKNWFIDLAAAYEQDFNDSTNTGLASFGVRFEAETIKANLGSEVSYDSSNQDSFKVTLRSGITGQLSKQQVISFAANYQLAPKQEGDFTLSYALRGSNLSLLSYHKLSTGETPILEGELAPTLHFGTQWQLRPAFAYKLPLNTPQGNTYLISLGGHYYLSKNYGLGSALYHEWQPATNSNATAISFEGSLRMIDEIWFILGYTVNGFDGLSNYTTNGLYLRLELFGGSQ